MKFIDSRAYRLADAVTNYFLLNLVWFVVCLPLVTAAPATVALFVVVRRWREDEGYEVLAPFFAAFRASFRRAFLVGLGWTIVGLILVVDLLASRRIPGAIAIPVLIAAGFLALLYCQLSTYLFPLLAHSRATPREIVRNAFLLTLSQPFRTIVAALGLIILALMTYFLPLVPLVVASSTAVALDAHFRRGVARFVPGALAGEIVLPQEKQAEESAETRD